jgi:hypothetical protein
VFGARNDWTTDCFPMFLKLVLAILEMARQDAPELPHRFHSFIEMRSYSRGAAVFT